MNLKYEFLIDDLKKKRVEFAGIGTNKAKRRLNNLSLIDPIAKAVRLALEIEDKSISAKNSYGKFKNKIYKQKTKYILELCNLFREKGWIFGIQENDVLVPSHIIYFEIPKCEQISWHFTPENEELFPVYMGKWDFKTNSTLSKLERITINLLERRS